MAGARETELSLLHRRREEELRSMSEAIMLRRYAASSFLPFVRGTRPNADLARVQRENLVLRSIVRDGMLLSSTEVEQLRFRLHCHECREVGYSAGAWEDLSEPPHKSLLPDELEMWEQPRRSWHEEGAGGVVAYLLSRSWALLGEVQGMLEEAHWEEDEDLGSISTISQVSSCA
ncbi:hypothetical protein GUITHDRAFT_114663 [Guillardia theta CCMP2712]|uniref:Uncharacterized protein n=1 Tax=Guillardia theta (strain CCMP2712) TaxID=905079 RepID=L1ISL6_GUITC|nr:hypothetical protein GUITHDRAFT_114663 [Guillardia theta CCMP2712]EKX39228.1 hypothetical protein GUITHDRAFT_114663 [Guillardia theta CCMP2712]|eukprot:XP_005826208.1 hypothetical protein GUITHDRAFT_114663 [Guillardia theta CCMP2712]